MSALAHAARRLAARPGYFATSVLTIALGVGINLGVFTVTRQVLVRSLSFADVDRLVVLGHLTHVPTPPFGSFSAPDVEDVRNTGGPFARAASYHFTPGTSTLGVAAPAGPVALETTYVDGAFFPTLGAQPLLGRTLRPDDDRVGANRVIVLSQRAWREHFNGDPAVLTRDTLVGGVPYRVVGVLPPEFGFPSYASDAWVPVTLITERMIPHARGVRWRSLVARLSPGASIDQARAALDTVLGRLAVEHPQSHRDFARSTVTPLSDHVLGQVRGPLWWISAAALCVFAVACANLVGLSIVRTASRAHEFAIRRALGAGRRQVADDLLAESMLIGLAGATASGAAVWAFQGAISRALVAQLPQAAALSVDGWIVAAGFVLALVAALAMALIPFGQMVNPDARRALGTSGDAGTASATVSSRTRGILVIVQTAAAVVLLAAAGLVVTSVQRLLQVDWGMQPASVVAFSVRPPEAAYPDNTTYAVMQRALLEQLRRLPGVTAAGAAKVMPHTDGGEVYEFLRITRDGTVREITPEAGSQIVSDGYVETLGIPLLFGRAFTADDIEQGVRGILVSAAFATRAFGVRNAVGEMLTLRTPDEDVDFRVLGVVDDVRHEGRLEGGSESIYMSAGVARRRTMKFFVRSDRPADDLMQAIAATVSRVDPLLPVSDLAPLDRTLAADVARPRLAARLIGGFSVMALALSALGLYGTLAYATVVRRRELGVRIALGATPGALLRQVLHEGLWLSAIGVVLGTVGVLALLQVARHVMFGIGTVEPAVLAAAVTLTLLVSIVASLAPAWRAATIDSVTALRSE